MIAGLGAVGCEKCGSMYCVGNPKSCRSAKWDATLKEWAAEREKRDADMRRIGLSNVEQAMTMTGECFQSDAHRKAFHDLQKDIRNVRRRFHSQPASGFRDGDYFTVLAILGGSAYFGWMDLAHVAFIAAVLLFPRALRSLARRRAVRLEEEGLENAVRFACQHARSVE